MTNIALRLFDAASVPTAEQQQAAATMQGGMLIFWCVALVLMFYFMVLRPQKKKEKEQKALRDSLKIGDEVTTIGGIVGFVFNIKDDIVVLETGADRSRICVKMWAISTNDTQHDAEEEIAKRK